MNRKSKELLRLLMILIGNILDAAGFVLFVSGSGLITGGTSGIGLFLSRQTGIPTSVYVFIINAVMLVVGLIFLGKRFALSTILSTFSIRWQWQLWNKRCTGLQLPMIFSYAPSWAVS